MSARRPRWYFVWTRRAVPLYEESIDGFARYEYGTPCLAVQSYSPQAARRAYLAALAEGLHGANADGVRGVPLVVHRSTAALVRRVGHPCCTVRMRRKGGAA